nr:type II secretion system F family protein [Salirhabdus salicampi]
MLIIIFTLLFGGIATFISRRRNPIERRLRRFIPKETESSPARPQTTINTDNEVQPTIKLFRIIAKVFKGKRFAEKWNRQLEQAGVPLKPEEFITIRVLLLLLSLVIVSLFNMNLLSRLIIPVFGWVLPVMILRNRREKRLARSSIQLPQALSTLATAMKSGFSFMQAMQLVSKEIPDPLGTEFGQAIREINLGISSEVAFQNMTERLPNEDLKLVVNAVIIQRSTGGNLAELLETIEETINERVRIKDELKALTAQGRMSAWIISLLPVVLGLFLNLMSPEYFGPMLTHPVGWLLLGLGIVSGVFGWILIQRIIKIEV